MKVAVVIPSRYGSSRLPGKPLADIGGKPMIERVYEQCSKLKSVDDVIVATDHKEIFDCVEAFGGKVVMTKTSHPSGTDRIQEAVEKLELKHNVIINVQGDEPFIDPKQIKGVIQLFEDKTVQIGTLKKKIEDEKEVFDNNVVKVVTDKKGFALYFSRQTIPFLRDVLPSQWFSEYNFHKHLGIYGYRREVLKEVTGLKPGALEQAESLEQLRWLESGYRIKVGLTKIDTRGIDTQSDLDGLNA